MHVRDARGAAGDAGLGQGLHLRLCVRHGAGPGLRVRHVRQRPGGELPRWIQRHGLGLRTGKGA